MQRREAVTDWGGSVMQRREAVTDWGGSVMQRREAVTDLDRNIMWRPPHNGFGCGRNGKEKNYR